MEVERRREEGDSRTSAGAYVPAYNKKIVYKQ